MIVRIWHGWTTQQNADIYENLLKTEIFPSIASKNIQGYQGIQLLRRSDSDDVEFIVIMWFESIDSVKQFAGEDYRQAYVPPSARRILSRFDDRVKHYQIREKLNN